MVPRQRPLATRPAEVFRSGMPNVALCPWGRARLRAMPCAWRHGAASLAPRTCQLRAPSLVGSPCTPGALRESDSEGIRTPAGRAQWISSPSPWPLGHTVNGACQNYRRRSQSAKFQPRGRPPVVRSFHCLTCIEMHLSQTWRAPAGGSPPSQGPHHHRQRVDSNPCGQSPMDFESISLAARTHCLGRRLEKLTTSCTEVLGLNAFPWKTSLRPCL